MKTLIPHPPIAHRLQAAPFLFVLVTIATLSCWNNVTRAATATFTTTAPTIGANDIGQLTGHVTSGSVANQKKSNVGGGDDNATYLDTGRPAQGQTFRTGSNPNGYQLTAVSLRQVIHNTYALVPEIIYSIRVTLPSGNSLTVLAEETAVVPEDGSDCATCNFPTISGGGSLGAGSGRYITFSFANPAVLSPNTVYGFDVGGSSSGHYWETDGRSCTPSGPNCNAMDLYTNGVAYSTGVNSFGTGNGQGDTVLTARTGDRVFVVKLTPVTTPIAPSISVQPQGASLYAGRSVTLSGKATGSPTIGYQWRRHGTNIANGGAVSGAQTDTLTISSLAASHDGPYTLVATNSAGGATSSPPAILTVVPAPVPGINYAYVVYTNNPLAYWRLNEASDPSTNPIAFEYFGGRNGIYGSANLNGFNGVLGPTSGGSPAFPGFAANNLAAQSTENTDQSWVTVPGLNLNTNTVTLTAWVYPIGNQAEDTGIFWTRAGTVAGIGYGGTFAGNAGQLIYCWNNADQTTWGFQSGLVIPSDQWSFVALVVEPAKATLYLGANAGTLSNAVNNVPHINELWAGNCRIGGDPQGNNLARTLNGKVDEVAVWRRALSFDEINALYGIGRGITQLVPPTIVNQPRSQALYSGHTARFNASAVGSAPLVYQWRKNGINVSNGGNISGAQTDSLTISNISAADIAAYTLLVTNAVGRATSSPPSTLAIVTPSGKSYEAAVRAANPVAYWRLNETGDPATNTVAFDYWGGLVGVYRSLAENGFNAIQGPRPPDFPEFETTNTALRTVPTTDQSWVTVPALNLNTNTVTFTAWIHPFIDHNNYEAIFYTRRGTIAGIQYTIDNQIGYTWNNGNQETWGFYSELRPPANQWSFIALVIEPTNAALYLYNTNGLFSTNNPIAHNSEAWGSTAEIGADPDSGISRNFDGLIDDVAVFNYSFTPAQVLQLYNAAFSPAVRLSIQKIGSNIQLSWPQGTLLEAPSITGPFTTNAATSPYQFAPTGTSKFFKIKVN